MVKTIYLSYTNNSYYYKFNANLIYFYSNLINSIRNINNINVRIISNIKIKNISDNNLIFHDIDDIWIRDFSPIKLNNN
jgi:hypothetical protein